jgi:hypothetical protein
MATFDLTLGASLPPEQLQALIRNARRDRARVLRDLWRDLFAWPGRPAIEAREAREPDRVAVSGCA